jgi:hypothetical protein
LVVWIGLLSHVVESLLNDAAVLALGGVEMLAREGEGGRAGRHRAIG